MSCSRLFNLPLLCLFLLAPNARALQIPGLGSLPSAATPQPPSVTPDRLGRETPRGCIMGFIAAAQDEKYAVAAEYFQPITGRRRRSAEDEEELASQLLVVLNHKFAGPLDFMSRDPEGRLDDGLPPDLEKVSTAIGTTEKFPILLIRVEDGQGRKLWYISRATIEHIPEVYESLVFPELEKKIPESLVTHRLLSMPLWQWLAIVLFTPFALLFGRLLSLCVELLLRASRKFRGLPPIPRHPLLSLGPGAFFMALLIHYWFVNYIGTSLLYRLYYRRVLWIALAVAFYWILTRITRAISSRIVGSLTIRGMQAERSIVSLIRRFVEVVIFLLVTLAVLHTLGLDVTTALAGVGIGGLALGLGAQKTFENMFGGVSILFDKVIQIGDTCKINNQTGVVEDIGLRSTRLRTFERTVLSIPNGIMATATLENLRFRDKFLCQQVIRLRYDLAPDHVRYVLDEIRQALMQNPKVEESTARVRFLRFAEYALEVEIYCYILVRDYAIFLETQELLLLEVMDTLEKTGAVVALPSQTTFVTKDAWIDPEKAKAVQAVIDKIRDPGVPGPISSSST
jgi:MscS family membrane protein